MLADIPHPYEVERFRLRHFKKLLIKLNDLDLNPRPDDGYFIPTSSGKAALCLALGYLHKTGKLKSKNDNILVPRWLDYWTYYVAQPYAFPVIEPTEATKAMLVFHQYGFPQNMKALLAFANECHLNVIEDCTQALDGSHKGQPMGTFGDYAIFSFSKYFPCIMGGGLWVRDSEAAKNILLEIAGNHSKFLQAWSIILKLYFELQPQSDARILGSGFTMCAKHPRANTIFRRLILHDMAGGAIEKRKKNWQVLRQSLSGLDILDDLEPDVVPYAVPAKIIAKKHKDVLESLSKIGLKTGFHNFDVGRNMLAPEFEKRLMLPIHQGLRISEIHLISDTVKNFSQ